MENTESSCVSLMFNGKLTPEEKWKSWTFRLVNFVVCFDSRGHCWLADLILEQETFCRILFIHPFRHAHNRGLDSQGLEFKSTEESSVRLCYS